MIRISKKADYAIFIMTRLALAADEAEQDRGDALLSAQGIARQSGLNKSVVANLLKDLTKAGLLNSVRGVHGGYRLAHPATEISLAQILVAVEGPFALVECAAHDEDCGGAPSSAASLLPGEPAAAEQSGNLDDSLGCLLGAVCTSKGPLQLLHDRIVGLMQDLRLNELSNKAQQDVELATARLQAIHRESTE